MKKEKLNKEEGEKTLHLNTKLEVVKDIKFYYHVSIINS